MPSNFKNTALEPRPRRWLDKPYHTLDFEMKQHFGQKIIKLAIDGGFSCPNRDGTVGFDGCLFCSDAGSGDFAGDLDAPANGAALGAPLLRPVTPIAQQIEAQKRLLQEKWPKAGYIAYFQSFTNTYASVRTLKQLYSEALDCTGILGLAIATRPDALSEEVLDYLEELSHQTYLWVELGLQTLDDGRARFLNRGYTAAQFESSYRKLQDRGIRTVLHLIAGIPDPGQASSSSPSENAAIPVWTPGRDDTDFITSMATMNRLKPWGLKIHLLHVLKGTALHRYYEKHPFPMPEYDDYIQLLARTVTALDSDITLHRITGDAPKSLMVAPWWSLNKRAVLNGFEKKLRDENSWQGKALDKTI